MHELSLCEGLLRQLEALATEHGQSAIKHITLRIGPLAGVEPELLRQAFMVARQGGIAAHAQLHIEDAPLTIHCPACKSIQPASLPRLSCPVCGSEETTVTGGDELLLVSVGFPTEQSDV